MIRSTPVSTRPYNPLKPIVALVLLGALVTLGACASVPPPTSQLALSTAAVSDAASAGGVEFAPGEMRAARDKLDRANLAMAAKDYDHARSLAQEAQVDAQLAGSKARSMKARQAADAVQEDGRVLRQEIDRKTQ